VVVPDMLGYGGSSKPSEPEEYTTKKLCADLAALLDVLEVQKAVSGLYHLRPPWFASLPIYAAFRW